MEHSIMDYLAHSSEQVSKSDVSSISFNGYYGFSALHNLNTNNKSLDYLSSNVKRRKRFFAREDCDGETVEANINATNTGTTGGKRCRFDKDFVLKHNDILDMPSTRVITTQSCLMDIEEYCTKHQQCHEPNEDMSVVLNNLYCYMEQQQQPLPSLQHH